jgi:hypothetical protein
MVVRLMAKIKTISDPDKIPEIVDVIHDCWFEKESIGLDDSNAALSIRFRRKKSDRKERARTGLLLRKTSVIFLECFLRIYHVEKYSIEDSANVGSYNFNEIRYDRSTGQLEISTGVPISINIKVKRFEVSVEETDTIVDRKESWSIWPW